MAITRAQQFRQMLEDGGMLVSPSRDGRRPGYRRSKYDSSGGGLGGSKSKTGRPDSPGPSNRDDAREQYSVFSKKTAKTGSKSFKKAKKDFKQDRDRIFAKPRKQPITFGAPNVLEDRFRPGGPLIPITKQRTFKNLLELDKKDPTKFIDETDDETLTDELKDKLKADRGLLSLNKLQKMGLPEADTPSMLANTILNATLPFRNEMLDKNIDYFKGVKKRAKNPGQGFYDLSEEGYSDYIKDRLAGKIDAAGNLKAGFMRDSAGNIISTGNDGRDSVGSDLEQRLQLLEQQNAALKNTTPTTTDSPLGGLGLRFLAEGGMTEDAPVGGIMDIESGRQMYFLGKLVKKATRAVKKVAKSPIGKAALFGAAAFGIPGTSFGGLLGRASFGGAAQGLFGTFGPTSALKKLGIMKSVGDAGMAATRTGPFAKFGIGSVITAASLLPLLGLGTGDESEEEAEEIIRGSGLDIASIRNNPYTFTSSVGGTGLGRRFVADGGRIGFRDGTSEFMDFVRSMGLSEDKLKQLDINSYNAVLQAFQRAKEGQKPQTEEKEMAEGGKAEPVAKDTMPLLKMGGKEMDLRDNGGFVPIGRMERADDVPARLSKNEFVFTADAVRNAGGGDIDKGAEVMYNMMQNLESGGEVSEESQGLKGAREMFQTSKRLEEVL